MKGKILLSLAVSLALPLAAYADNVGQCGWGSRLMKGGHGIFPQVLAVTTNGTSGNQTFGISSGTSGCTQDGTVESNWKTAAYIESNKEKLARDVSRGSGEAIESLAALMGIAPEDKELFFSAAKANFTKLFPSADVSQTEVTASLRNLVAETPGLEGYRASL